MRRFGSCLVAVFAVFAFATTSFAWDIHGDYLESLADYYDVKKSEVVQVVDAGIDTEELPVVMFVADRAGAAPMDVAGDRLAGDPWHSIVTARGLDMEIFYIYISGEVRSRTYQPIFDRFADAPRSEWARMPLTDSEIRDLVNLKFISSHHDYNAYDVMAMRDYGKTFQRINQQVKQAKEKQYAKMKADLRSAAKAGM